MSESKFLETRKRRANAARTAKASDGQLGQIARSKHSPTSSKSPAIYYFEGAPGTEGFRKAADLGFNLVGLPKLDHGVLAAAAQAARTSALALIVDLDISATSRRENGWDARTATAGWISKEFEERTYDENVALWDREVSTLQDIGVNDFRCLNILSIPPAAWNVLISAAKARHSGARFYAWTPGVNAVEISKLYEVNFDFSFSSSCWWDLKSGWLNADAKRNAKIGPAVAMAVPPNVKWPSEISQRERAIDLAAFYGAGWLVPSGFEICEGNDLATRISHLNKMRLDHSVFQIDDSAHVVSSTGSEVGALERGRCAAMILNTSTTKGTTFSPHVIAPKLSGTLTAIGKGSFTANEIFLPPAGTQFFALQSVEMIRNRDEIPVNCDAARIAIENITPKVDDGHFPVRKIVGQRITVEADLIADGHDKIAANIMWRPADESNWQSVPMKLVTNDRWRSEFSLPRIGRYLYRVSVWNDFYGTFIDEITKKYDAGVAITLELQEGMLQIQEAIAHAAEPGRSQLEALFNKIDGAKDDDIRLAVSSSDVIQLMRASAPKKFFVVSSDVIVDAERPAARFANWYEIFPRSQSADASRHGTFTDVIGQLPRIASMGFNVLYFPPIHPIGRINRKGRNNTLTPSAEDPGSPYAIGSTEGGHDAIHPKLGTFEDFTSLIEAAAQHDIEIAIDFAIQCAPDHPWLAEHKNWFDWRPDGSLKYAENPPKKYEDIVNVDFYADGAKPSLWLALRDIIQFWVDRGIRTFRVDNPHTKPLPFWEWLIGDIRSRNPDIIFLAEAFTRPKLMYRLAKIGFSQSYTYFTWRNTKAELTEYLSELNEPPQRDFFGPHFFVNTPDINPFFLQNSGRSGFLIRAALAATLSGLWGVYNGFEICESSPFAPGKEEYLDSEKYQIRHWNYNDTNNIVAEITRLNEIRGSNAALQTHLGVKFHTAFDDDVLYFSKSAEDGNTVLVAICLDPFQRHEFEIELPVWLFGLPDDASFVASDLMRDFDFVWHGKRQTVILHPESPFCIWRISAQDQ